MHMRHFDFHNSQPLVSPTDDARVKTQWLAVGALLGFPMGLAFGLMAPLVWGAL